MTPWTFFCPICRTELSEDNASWNTDYTRGPEVRCDCGATSVWPEDGAEVNGHIIGVPGSSVALESRADMCLIASINSIEIEVDQDDSDSRTRLVDYVFRDMVVHSVMRS